MFGTSIVKFHEGPFSKEDMTISQINYRVDFDAREIYVEKETPRIAIERAILRGIIKMWQNDNELLISYAEAQLEFEELEYLKSKNYENKIEQITQQYDVNMSSDVEQIREAIESEDSTVKSSFAFMRKQYAEIMEESDLENVISDEEPGELYDPMKTPRFWKRYLRGGKITDGEDKLSSDDRVEEEESADEEDYSSEQSTVEESESNEQESEVAVTEDAFEEPVAQEENEQEF